jgi:hypothetical protein
MDNTTKIVLAILGAGALIAGSLFFSRSDTPPTPSPRVIVPSAPVVTERPEAPLTDVGCRLAEGNWLWIPDPNAPFDGTCIPV